MKFEWDDAKSEFCFHQRGFDFAYVIKAFFDPDRLVREDNRYVYGEERYQLIGSIEGRLYVIVFTPRHKVTRIISARKANQREVKQYENRSDYD